MAVTPLAAPAKSLDDNARLSELIIKGRNGSVFDLSPNFQPDVSQYGAMVRADSKDATLCFHTLEGQFFYLLLRPLSAPTLLVASHSDLPPHRSACTVKVMLPLLNLSAAQRAYCCCEYSSDPSRVCIYGVLHAFQFT